MTSQVARFFQNEAPFLLDGGMATELESRGATLDHALWSARLLADNPNLIRAVHRSYLDAGARILSTATYQLNDHDLAQLGLDDSLYGKAALLAEEAIASLGPTKRPRTLIAASLGPFGASLGDGSEYTGEYLSHTDQEIESWHRSRVLKMASTSSDVMAFETIPTMAEARIIINLMKDLPAVPYWISFQLRGATSLANGDALEDAIALVQGARDLVAIGFNCLSPDLVAVAIETAKKQTKKPIIAYPNSGELYRDGSWTDGGATQSILSLAPTWLKAGVSAIGGCCRVGPETIRQVGALLS